MCQAVCGLCVCQLEDRQPLEYLSEMRQVTIVFINLLLVESLSKIELCGILQKAFDAIYTQVKRMQGLDQSVGCL